MWNMRFDLLYCSKNRWNLSYTMIVDVCLIFLTMNILLPVLPISAVDVNSSPSQSLVNFSGIRFMPWNPSHLQVLKNGNQIQLVLDQIAGSGLASMDRYFFGNFQIQMKVAPGDTAGTVTSFYLSSVPETSQELRDELDFEFLGNVSGEPYLLQTNVFTNGTGYREQRIKLWFDPTADFHTYRISWTKQTVVFSVDGVVIRTYPNNAKWGQLYVDRHSMGAYVSIWNGDDWATLGGLVKINWTAAPFQAWYQNLKVNACIYTGNLADCMQTKLAKFFRPPLQTHLYSEEDVDMEPSLKWVQDNLMVYNYCDDEERFSDLPPECRIRPST